MGESKIERGILRALTVASADDNARWIHSEVPDGNIVAQPLDQLLPYLKDGDYVGPTLSAAREELLSQAKHLVLTGAFSQTWVFVWAIIGSALGIIMQGIVSAGESTGRFIYWVIFSGAIAIGPLYHVLVVTANSVARSDAPTAAAHGVNKIFAYPTNVGERALGIFNQTIGDWLRTTRIPDVSFQRTKSLILQTRLWAGLVIYGAACLAAVAVLVFGVSAAASFMEEDTKKPVPAECWRTEEFRPSYCPTPPYGR